MTDAMINGQLVRVLREAKGMSQTELAAAAATSQAVISRLEQGLQGNFKLGPVVRVARTLGTGVDALLLPPVKSAPAVLEDQLIAVVQLLALLSADDQRRLAAMLAAFVAASALE